MKRGQRYQVKPKTASSKPSSPYYALVMTVWDAISIYHAPDIFLTQFNSAPVPARTLFAAHWLQSEVRNGGLHQFFGNSTGVLAPEAVAAYRTLGMPKVASVIEAATRWFGPDYPRRREIREELLGAYETEHPEAWNPFTQLDNGFFDLINHENGGFLEAANAYATGQHG